MQVVHDASKPPHEAQNCRILGTLQNKWLALQREKRVSVCVRERARERARTSEQASARERASESESESVSESESERASET